MTPRKLSPRLRPIAKSPISTKSTSAAYRSPGVYVQEVSSGPRRIAAAPTDVALFIGQTAIGAPLIPQTCTSESEFARHFGSGGTTDAMEHYVRLFFLNGGRRCVVIKLPGTSASDYSAAFAAVESAKIDFNLLVLVPEGAQAIETHYPAASRFCREHEALLLMDPPLAWTRAAIAVTDAKTRLTGVVGDYAAVYFPGLRLPGGRTLGAAGAVAGVVARTDHTRGVWKAPAGLEATIHGTVQAPDPLTRGEVDTLNPSGINALHIPRDQLVVWGARTWANQGEFRYIPVRRLASHVKKSLAQGLSWVAFEPNTPTLWTEIRACAENFLQGLFREGAFAGSSAREAYFVRCDRTTMSATDEAAGRVILDVAVSPLKPAEFIMLRLILQAAT